MIYDITPVNNYQGNGTTTHFDFDFYIEKASQLNVYFFDENNIKIKLQYGIDYSINEFKNPEGSYITFPIENSNYEILNTNQKLSLELTLPVSQETQYNNSSLLNLEALEYSFDYLTRLIQILARKLTLCVKVEECSEISPEQLISSINDKAALVQTSLTAVQNYTAQTQNTYTNLSNLAQETIEEIDEKSDELLSLIQGDMSIINALENNKANIDFSNVPTSRAFLVESYSNNSSWYRVYSDGWCEQGGFISKESVSLLNIDISLLKTFSAPLGCFANLPVVSENSFDVKAKFEDNSTLSVGIGGGTSWKDAYWIAFGYTSIGENNGD